MSGDWGLGIGQEDAGTRRNFLPVGEFRLRGNRAKSRFNYAFALASPIGEDRLL
ncbi:MAG: hypothetical protein KME21_25345 [Desmonostoc vinosum HA7617-LM4]|nr:hypothetical protein [Desmonostoc vinosum HA7617-LM4]